MLMKDTPVVDFVLVAVRVEVSYIKVKQQQNFV